jgi:peptidoglycan/xylan/chitin deacetylase (PgdA/CDA1 family)
MNDVIPVLVYHSVADEPPPGERRWTVTPDELAAHLDVVRDSGRIPVTISQLATALRARRVLERPVMAFTFDDGNADNLAAVAALSARRWPATVYVTTGAVDTPGHLSADQIARLAALPLVEVGAHTVGHPYLDELGEDELHDEVAGSKADLERLTGTEARTFAYPYGAYDRRVRDAVVAAGFDSACAVKNALSHRADDPFAIARWIVEHGTPPERLAEVLAGRGLPRAWARERLRTTAYRRARRLRRRLVVAS